jgi:hypothetical protein
MANLNPVAGRLARRSKRSSGDVRQLQAKLWKCIGEAELVMIGGDSTEKLKAAHCLSQVAMTYLKTVEIGELEARLEELERRAAA